MAEGKVEKRIKKGLSREDKGEGKEGGAKKHHVHGMHIRRAAGGGFIARHDMADEDGNPPEPGQGPASPEHILPDMDAAQAHMDQHMGDQPAAGEAPAPGPDQGDEAAQG